MLLRIAPFIVGLVAVHVWLRRREVERKALAAPTARFQRRPIDIVTVVDDLLLAGR